MAYVIRRKTGKLEEAKPISSLTSEQKKVFKVPTSKQRARVHAAKAKLKASSSLHVSAL